MGGPSWLAWTFASVMIITAVYCLARLLASWRQHRRSDRQVDAIHVLMGVAMAGMLVPRLRVFWVGGWEVIFGIGAAWFAWLAVREFRGQRTAGGQPGHHLQHMLACVAMLYMFLAVTTTAKAASGGTAMSGMTAGTAHFPTLALVLALALFGYVIWTTDRLSSLAPVAMLAVQGRPAPILVGDGVGGRGISMTDARDEDHGTAPRTDSRAASGRDRAAPLSPRLAACCEIAMGVTMGYMLILML
jgi:cytochrome b561